MRHFILTCRNHPDLRWSCKEVAWRGGRDGWYDGSRRIFFNGPGPECDCPVDQLTLAPEETGVRTKGWEL